MRSKSIKKVSELYVGKEVERTGGRAIEIGELRFIIYSEQAVLIYTIIREKTPVS